MPSNVPWDNLCQVAQQPDGKMPPTTAISDKIHTFAGCATPWNVLVYPDSTFSSWIPPEICEPNSHVSGWEHGREVLRAYSDPFLGGSRPQEELAGKDLPAGFAEVFREESVDDGVDARVPVG